MRLACDHRGVGKVGEHAPSTAANKQVSSSAAAPGVEMAGRGPSLLLPALATTVRPGLQCAPPAYSAAEPGERAKRGGRRVNHTSPISSTKITAEARKMSSAARVKACWSTRRWSWARAALSLRPALRKPVLRVVSGMKNSAIAAPCSKRSSPTAWARANRAWAAAKLGWPARAGSINASRDPLSWACLATPRRQQPAGRSAASRQ